MTDLATSSSTATTRRIMELNDAMRVGGVSIGNWTITAGIRNEGPLFVGAAIHAVQTFDSFTEDNDPYGEHDFGSFTIQDQKLFWKIDYYDTAYQMGSPEASDPTVTRRVITIMLASEY